METMLNTDCLPEAPQCPHQLVSTLSCAKHGRNFTLMRFEEGLSAWLARRGCLMGQAASFLAAGGSPTPKLLVV